MAVSGNREEHQMPRILLGLHVLLGSVRSLLLRLGAFEHSGCPRPCRGWTNFMAVFLNYKKVLCGMVSKGYRQFVSSFPKFPRVYTLILFLHRGWAAFFLPNFIVFGSLCQILIPRCFLSKRKISPLIPSALGTKGTLNFSLAPAESLHKPERSQQLQNGLP